MTSSLDRRQMLFALAASLLAPLEAAAQTALERAFTPANGGRIDPQTVNGLLPAAGGSIDALMIKLLPIAQTYARPPISKFQAGAIVRGRSGALYAGANLELPPGGLSQTVHGEQAALANAFNQKETGITAIAVSDAPCGLCRQFLNEVAGAETLRILTPSSRPRLLKDLLPDSFGPKDLQQTEALFASTPRALRLPAPTSEQIVAAALDAASRSYAPYSKSPSGCAVETKTGTIVSGSYLENAAFNPSLAPLQSALVSLMMRRESFADITRVVLVEASGATISHFSETRSVVAAIARGARLEMRIAT